MTGRVPVLVCGEPNRGDDGAALAALALLAPETLARAEVIVVGQLGVQDLLDAAEAGCGCVVADAVAGIAPGEVCVRPLAALTEPGPGRPQGPGRRPAPRSSHELPLEQAVAMVAALRGSPPTGTFVGVGGAGWGIGAPLSPAVAAALPAFAAAISAAVEELRGG